MKWKCNLYCLQVTFCALLIWVVIINVFLYIFFPSKPSRDVLDDEQSALPTDRRHLVQRYLNLMTLAGLQVFLVDSVVLESISGLKWNELATPTVLEFGTYHPVSCELLFEHMEHWTCVNMHPNVLLEAHSAQHFAVELIYFETITVGNYPYYLARGLIWDLTLFEPFRLDTHAIDEHAMQVPVDVEGFLAAVHNNRFIECNTTRAADYFATNRAQAALQRSPEGQDFRRRVHHLLEKASHAFLAADDQFWISSGTLLGWFRQCDVIPYGGDADIGVWASDYDSSLIAFMENEGLQLKMQLGLPNDSFQLSFWSKNTKLDVYFFYEAEGYVWNGATKPETGEKYKYRFPHFQLCTTIFLELVVRVPCETLPYIEANYGPGWFAPDMRWKWQSSPPNVEPNGVWSDEVRNVTVQVYDHV